MQEKLVGRNKKERKLKTLYWTKSIQEWEREKWTFLDMLPPSIGSLEPKRLDTIALTSQGKARKAIKLSVTT